MLIGIDPKTTPALLACLARMGHGDEIAVVDSNFPATSTAAECTHKQVIHYPGSDAPAVVDLITKLMPIDPFHEYGALRMEIDDAPDEMNGAHQAAWDILNARLPEGAKLSSILRQKFYTQARRCFAVVQCDEHRPFVCFILRKGVIF